MNIEDLLSEVTQSVRTNFEINRITLPYGKRRFTDALGYAHPGNLRNNAYKLVNKGENKWDIVMDLNIAPYAEYINEPGYRTSGYWEVTVRRIMEGVAKDLGGTIEKGNV